MTGLRVTSPSLKATNAASKLSWLAGLFAKSIHLCAIIRRIPRVLASDVVRAS
jgi:hypothetical protein